MKRALLSSSVLALVLVGCGRAAIAPSMIPLPASTSVIDDGLPDPETPAAKKELAQKPTDPTLSRKPGDFVVFKFSGTFRKNALTLTERVVAREGNVLAIDFTLSEGGKEQTLRAKIDHSPGSKGEIFGVVKLEKGQEIPSDVAAYEAMMTKTMLAADDNEETLGSEKVTIEIGGKPFACEKTSYRVRIGKKSATMTITHSDAFAWGDVGGEITTADGTVLYRAEIIDAGTTPVVEETKVAELN